ncbi:adenosine monophosphate-protein transferase [Parapedobacter defluvii]|uniref:Adenosine monophosphate-protein transferase n=2 Tax=Parapedobacter defluvii TaxID=2045106 RepID=A0ABQ1MMA6_9SPHI|nr:adenosine monophosphate-protein transferase [Parapedobacter defluvii]
MVLKQLAAAHRYLALLNGRCATIPNENILINTLALQEAKESSAIENIITTHDEVYKAELFESFFNDAAAKEVHRYAQALKHGFQEVRKNKLITQVHIQNIQRTLENNDAGYRRNAGTVLKNERTGEVVYTPPQDHPTIQKLMDNLVHFMNDEEMSGIDALIKMAIIHHRFETIHPFYDGNGRTGRIINILYLVKEDLLTLPILYLSRYIIQYKGDYYRLLQQVREDGDWEPWIIFILKGVEETSKQTLHLIDGIKRLMQAYKNRIRSEFPKIYSQDLLNNLFKHPYTKIEFLEQDIKVTRQTAATYLNKLAEAGLLVKIKIGKSNFYINDPLYNLFSEGVPPAQSVEPITTITT